MNQLIRHTSAFLKVVVILSFVGMSLENAWMPFLAAYSTVPFVMLMFYLVIGMKPALAAILSVLYGAGNAITGGIDVSEPSLAILFALGYVSVLIFTEEALDKTIVPL